MALVILPVDKQNFPPDECAICGMKGKVSINSVRIDGITYDRRMWYDMLSFGLHSPEIQIPSHNACAKNQNMRWFMKRLKAWALVLFGIMNAYFNFNNDRILLMLGLCFIIPVPIFFAYRYWTRKYPRTFYAYMDGENVCCTFSDKSYAESLSG